MPEYDITKFSWISKSKQLITYESALENFPKDDSTTHILIKGKKKEYRICSRNKYT